MTRRFKAALFLALATLLAWPAQAFQTQEEADSYYKRFVTEVPGAVS